MSTHCRNGCLGTSKDADQLCRWHLCIAKTLHISLETSQCFFKHREDLGGGILNVECLADSISPTKNILPFQYCLVGSIQPSFIMNIKAVEPGFTSTQVTGQAILNSQHSSNDITICMSLHTHMYTGLVGAHALNHKIEPLAEFADNMIYLAKLSIACFTNPISLLKF